MAFKTSLTVELERNLSYMKPWV